MDKSLKVFEVLLKNKYKKFGLSRKTVKHLKKVNEYKITKLNFKKYKIVISNPYWFLHSVEELFIEETYTFNSSLANPTIIDCGANWGLSVIFFKELYPGAQIVAFEPDPQVFKLLSENVTYNGFDDVQLENKAVWINESELSFFSDKGLGGCLTEVGIKKREKVQVKTVRLKEILKNYSQVEFLKIDIEGAEYEVIKDCKDSLSHIKYLFVEYHSTPHREQKLGEILTILKDAGFRYYIKEAWENMVHPFKANENLYYDLQLNIFCYR